MLPNGFKRAFHALLTSLSRRAQFIHEARTSDIDADPAFKAIYRACRGYTMTSISRMYALYQAVDYLADHGIAGDVVECGVWRGGSSMLVARTLLARGDTERGLYLYDTFEGMSEPTERDVDLHDRSAGALLQSSPRNSNVWAEASLEDVRANMAVTGYPPDRLAFVKGRVEDTIPATVPDRIALLRLDTDWYESTYHELVHLFPRLVPNGVLIVDDYGYWKGAREAVDRYLAEHGVTILLNRIDFTGRIGIKTATAGPVT
jgi:hypothetical protein